MLYDDAICFGETRLDGARYYWDGQEEHDEGGDDDGDDAQGEMNMQQQRRRHRSWVQISDFERRPEPKLVIANETNPHRPQHWSVDLSGKNSDHGDDDNECDFVSRALKGFVIVCSRKEDATWIEEVNRKYGSSVFARHKIDGNGSVAVTKSFSSSASSSSSSSSLSSSSPPPPFVLESLSSLSLICDGLNQLQLQKQQQSDRTSRFSLQDFVGGAASSLPFLSLMLASASSSSIESLALVIEDILFKAGLYSVQARVRTGYCYTLKPSADDEQHQQQQGEHDTGNGQRRQRSTAAAALLDNSTTTTFSITNKEDLDTVLYNCCYGETAMAKRSLIIHYTTSKKHTHRKNKESSDITIDSRSISWLPDGAPYGNAALLVGFSIEEEEAEIAIADNSENEKNQGNDSGGGGGNKPTKHGQGGQQQSQQQSGHKRQTLTFHFKDANPLSTFCRSWSMSSDELFELIDGMVLIERTGKSAANGNQQHEADMIHLEQVPKRYRRVDVINEFSARVNVPFFFFDPERRSNTPPSSLFSFLFTLSICFSQLGVAVSPQQLNEVYSSLLNKSTTNNHHNDDGNSSSNNNNLSLSLVEELYQVSSHFLETEKNRKLNSSSSPSAPSSLLLLGRIKCSKVRVCEQFASGILQELFEEHAHHQNDDASVTSSAVVNNNNTTSNNDADDDDVEGKNVDTADEIRLPRFLARRATTDMVGVSDRDTAAVGLDHDSSRQEPTRRSRRKICMFIFDVNALIGHPCSREHGESDDNQQVRNWSCCIVEGFDAENGIVHLVDCCCCCCNGSSSAQQEHEKRLQQHKFGRRWKMTIEEMIKCGRAAFGGGDRKDLSFPVLVLEEN